MDKMQSDIINSIKVPLIILVVFIHTIPDNIHPVSINLSGENIYAIVSELISHNFGYIAVPTFFFISGYFLFNKVNQWSFKLYWGNLKKKTLTLLFPYLVWNLLYILLIWGKVSVFNRLNLSIHEYEQDLLLTPMYEHLIYPINYPLWYVRDLICMNVISFILFFIVRHLRWAGVGMLFLLYLSGAESGIPGFSNTAIFFVTSGAYMGYYRMDILDTFSKIKLAAFIGLLLLVPLAMYYNQSSYVAYLNRLYIPLGVISIFNLGGYLYNAFPRIGETFVKLSAAVFFIYVTHTIYVINWVIGGLGMLHCTEGASKLIPYFLTPAITIAICGTGFVIFKKLFPKLFSITMGGR